MSDLDNVADGGMDDVQAGYTEQQVAGLKANHDRLLREVKDARAKARQYEGIAKRLEGVDIDELLALRAASDEPAPEPATVSEPGADKKLEALMRRLEAKQATVEKERDEYRQRAEAERNARLDLESTTRLNAEVAKAGVDARYLSDVVRLAKLDTRYDPDARQHILTADGEDQLGPDGSPMTVKDWLDERRDTHPHYFGESAGGGARGSGGRTPPRPKRSTMTDQDRLDFVIRYGQDEYLKLPA